MGREILFISDLHLDPERPTGERLFLDFLQRRARGASALYILGDLFEIWLGDDAILPASKPILNALGRLADEGVELHVMHGNRDFLLGEGFCTLTGARLLEDPALIQLNGTPTLLMHGDLLCTDDTDYQKFRAMVRSPAWQREQLSKSPQQRLELARRLRQQSRSAGGTKRAEIMDVNQSTVENTMRSHGARQLIHGHTHRPAEHRFTLDEQPATRFVLPEWSGEKGGLLCFDGRRLFHESYAC